MPAGRQPAAHPERESASPGGRDPDGASKGVGGKPAGQRQIDRHRCRIDVGRAQCHAHDLIERGIRAGHFSCLIQRYRYARRDSEGPLNVAYVPGVGDNVAPILRELGVPLTIVDPDDIPQTDLSKFTAIVVGPRAYQASQTLIDNNEYLLSYVRNGGRLVVQYGQNEMQRPGIMPYPVTLRQPAERVTDENAPVTFTDPGSPLLNSPNKITQADFTGWVQERSTYMPSTFDARYRTMLAMNDPGEQPNRAAILAARYGRGTYVYVPLALFRQLPAGVSGGARIFANLLGGNQIK